MLPFVPFVNLNHSLVQVLICTLQLKIHLPKGSHVLVSQLQEGIGILVDEELVLLAQGPSLFQQGGCVFTELLCVDEGPARSRNSRETCVRDCQQTVSQSAPAKSPGPPHSSSSPGW